jgi:hypothetical protein
MTMREIGHSFQDWFQEMFWIARYGSWFDLTILQFLVVSIIVGLFLYLLAVVVFNIVRGFFRWLVTRTKDQWIEFSKEVALFIVTSIVIGGGVLLLILWLLGFLD